MNAHILVGVDGSPSALEAVGTAAREAELRGCALRIVHAFIWPLMRVPLGPSELGPADGGLRHEAEKIVADAEQHAREVAPGVDVGSAILAGEPLTVLEAESRDAALVVVGSRGLGSFSGLLLGSAAVHLSAHAHCPVLVVRGKAQPSGDVVLAADGSAAGAAAVRFAFLEASLRGADLVAVHTWNNWTGPVSSGPGDPVPLVYDEAMLKDEEERVLAEALSGLQDEFPDVVVHRRLVEGRTRQTLIEASEDAQLLVVGARGRGGFAGLLLGSVSQAVLHHAHCPVAVVRRPDARR